MVTLNGLLLVVILIFVTLTFLWFMRAMKFFLAEHVIPGPVPVPLIGNILIGILAKFDVLVFLSKLRQYGELVLFWLGPYPCVLVEAPEYLHVFFDDPAALDRPPHSHIFNHLLGEGNAVISNGNEWKYARAAMHHGLNSMSQSTLLELVQQGSKRMLDELNKHADKEFFEFLPVARKYNFDLVTRLAIGEELKDPEFIHANGDYFEEAMDLIMMRIFSPIHYLDATFFLTKESKAYKLLKDKSRNAAIKLLQEAKKERQECMDSGKDIPNRYVHNLLQAYGQESPDFFYAHIQTLYGTGVDTSTNGATFLIMLLGLHPEIQDRLFEEDMRIQEELKGRRFEVADINRYEYLNMVFKESLRLMPAIPFVAKHTCADAVFGKYKVPKGTILFGSLLYTMRNEKYFPNPWKFDPERFHPNNSENIVPNSYLPFGHGRRACLGYKLATMSIKCMTMLMVRNYKIFTEYKTVQEINKNVTGSITMKDRNQGRIRLERRR